MRDIKSDFFKLPERPLNSHKGTFGRILNIAGSKKYSGAAVLSSLSALKSGAGYVTLACHESVISSVSSYTPDITFLPLRIATNNFSCEENVRTILEKISGYNVLAVGCGLTTEKFVSEFVLKLFPNVKIPTVIDADGLSIIAENDFGKFEFPSVITPHPKELSRLMNTDVGEIQNDREKYCREAALKYNTICVLKGHNTVVSDGEKVYINFSGNSALSKAGSGDVLTGLISGFAAQGCSLFDAAVLGVYIHGVCGELAAEDLTEYSVLASDLLTYIPNAIKKLL